MASAPPYNIIYADPPWLFKARGSNSGRQVPYPCMTTAEIAALPVSSLCAQDCVLFLWTINSHLPDALEVIGTWGFTFKNVGFTWVKSNASGNRFHFGMGYWTRANPELCLFATRGNPQRVSKAVPNLLIAPRREHSRKPDEARDRIVRLCGDLPRIELFAREYPVGWSVWGNEVKSDLRVASQLEARP